MTRAAIEITLPPDLLAAARERVGNRGLSALVARLLRSHLDDVADPDDEDDEDDGTRLQLQLQASLPRHDWQDNGTGRLIWRGDAAQVPAAVDRAREMGLVIGGGWVTRLCAARTAVNANNQGE